MVITAAHAYGSSTNNKTMDLPVLNESVVVLDFETTGLRADGGDRITEIAALRVSGNQIVERYEALVNCEMRIPRHISKFTGITQAMVDSGVAPQQAFPELLSFIGSSPVITHNAAFDQGFLDCECERLYLQRNDADFICTVQLARILLPQLRSHALGALTSSLQLPFAANAHRAGVDAEATVNVLWALTDIVRNQLLLDHVDANTLRQLIQEQPASSSVPASAEATVVSANRAA